MRLSTKAAGDGNLVQSATFKHQSLSPSHPSLQDIGVRRRTKTGFEGSGELPDAQPGQGRQILACDMRHRIGSDVLFHTANLPRGQAASGRRRAPRDHVQRFLHAGSRAKGIAARDASRLVEQSGEQDGVRPWRRRNGHDLGSPRQERRDATNPHSSALLPKAPAQA